MNKNNTVATKVNHYREVDYEIIKEDWNKYILEDNSRIKGRLILTRVLQSKENLKEYTFDFSLPLYVVSCNEDQMGETNKEPQQQELTKLPQQEIAIKEQFEKWNEYKISNNRLKIKLVVSEIRRVINRFDLNGYPYYIINGGPAVTLT